MQLFNTWQIAKLAASWNHIRITNTRVYYEAIWRLKLILCTIFFKMILQLERDFYMWLARGLGFSVKSVGLVMVFVFAFLRYTNLSLLVPKFRGKLDLTPAVWAPKLRRANNGNFDVNMSVIKFIGWWVYFQSVCLSLPFCNTGLWYC
jgi:hypothetical protein